MLLTKEEETDILGFSIIFEVLDDITFEVRSNILLVKDFVDVSWIDTVLFKDEKDLLVDTDVWLSSGCVSVIIPVMLGLRLVALVIKMVFSIVLDDRNKLGENVSKIDSLLFIVDIFVLIVKDQTVSSKTKNRVTFRTSNFNQAEK